MLDEFRSGSVEGYPSVLGIIADSKQLQEAQDLFELYQSDYLKLQRCSEELGHLKSLWDTVGTVMFTFRDWYKTPWDRIDVDFLVEETKKLSKVGRGKCTPSARWYWAVAFLCMGLSRSVGQHRRFFHGYMSGHVPLAAFQSALSSLTPWPVLISCQSSCLLLRLAQLFRFCSHTTRLQICIR